ncbi:triose-phosphate isomerase [Pseudothauera nasutitermitis]|uniref:Triosephosphate isomerase n=1 Tax=Pseudothauera nasutitermitis TaxID=2565930 RepID=A0A4S4B531_9RHOO|nr:triose-phosphate isomerase [Pseudothauera nasutitermitis]THF66906.1 triose-phosphate isomerase [Pseudothauera nasutitermitis]
MNKLVAGNWKMNGSLAANAALLGELASSGVAGVECAVCVPYPYLAQARALLDGGVLMLGAQDVSEYAVGAYTGEVSGAMLAEFGCRYAIVGHSERRALFGEDDAAVGRKAAAALAAGLTPIVCVGETLAEREGGVTLAVLERQLDAVAAVLGREALAGVVLAYEPVWAIGSGRSASIGQVGEAHAGIRAWLREHCARPADVPILYGGSVKPENAAELFSVDEVDGGLIGGASLVANDFLAICRAAADAQP